jgi:type II secretory pathway pseudopilin PulG
VVVAIIGLVAAIAIPRYLRSLNRGRQSDTMESMRAVEQELTFAIMRGRGYPLCPGGEAATWSRCRLDEVLPPPDPRAGPDRASRSDGWGHPLLYESDGSSYRIISGGRNGLVDHPLSPETRDSFDHDIVLEEGRFTAAPY